MAQKSLCVQFWLEVKYVFLEGGAPLNNHDKFLKRKE